jgi:hypothetical protein
MLWFGGECVGALSNFRLSAQVRDAIQRYVEVEMRLAMRKLDPKIASRTIRTIT